jgi:hypothetical protein
MNQPRRKNRERPDGGAPLPAGSSSARLLRIRQRPQPVEAPRGDDEPLPAHVREFLDWLVDRELARWLKG